MRTSTSLLLTALLASSALAAPLYNPSVADESSALERRGAGKIVGKVVHHLEKNGKHYKNMAHLAGGVVNAYQNQRRSLDDVDYEMYAREFEDEAELDERNIFGSVLKDVIKHKKGKVAKAGANAASNSNSNPQQQQRSMDDFDEEEFVAREFEDDAELDERGIFGTIVKDVVKHKKGKIAKAGANAASNSNNNQQQQRSLDDFDEEEFVARSVAEDELEWDVAARDVEEFDGEDALEDRSKIGKKIGGFFKHLIGLRSVGEDELEWDIAARDVEEFDGEELEDRSKIGKKIGGFFKHLIGL